MATNDEKLSKFNQAINHYAEEQRKKIEEEVSSYKQHELEDAEVEVLSEAYRLIQDEMAEMRDGIVREMAHREMDVRRELLEKRQKITDEVFEKASARLKEFTVGPEYPKTLQHYAENLSSAFNGQDTTLFVKEADLQYCELIKAAFGSCEVRADSEILIGGIRAFNPTAGIMADETLDSMLEEQREWFEENSGMAVV